MWIDINSSERICLNANVADKLGTLNVGSYSKPMYLEKGEPKPCGDVLNTNITGSADTVDGYHGKDLVKYNDALLTVNPFGGKKLYISRIDNALYAANLRYNVIGRVYDKTSGKELRTLSCNNLFNGRYDEVAIETNASEILKVTIDFTDTDWGFFGPYGYGYFYLSFYHQSVPDNVTARVYSNYTGHTVGWYNLPVTEISENRYPGGKIYAVRNDYYKIEQIEFTFNPGTTNICLSEIECFLDRGQDKYTTPVLNKYEPETLYYPLTAPEFIGNATSATKLNGTSVGSYNSPVYFNNGSPVACEPMLPLSAGPSKKLTGPLGLTKDVMYGKELPSTGFEGQLFFLEEEALENPIYVPEGGLQGQALVKKSDVSGDIAWQNIVALPTGGSKGQILTKNSTTNGDASWQTPAYLSTSGGTVSGTITATQFSGPLNGTATNATNIYSSASTSKAYILGTTTASSANHATVYNASVYTSGSVLYGAAWNDYAEYRSQKENIEPGYCVASDNNGQVYKTIEKFQACDGIVSDTFGFAIGETDDCCTPLAVAGRVLAYCSGNRNDYQAGDTVCAGPEGKVIKMTREEIKEYPDRIVGIVSEIPKYETWGSGNVPVNGRIWIKIK